VRFVENVWESQHFGLRIFRAVLAAPVSRAELAEATAATPEHDLLELVVHGDGEALDFATACGFRPIIVFDHYSHVLEGGSVAGHVRSARGWLKQVRRALPSDAQHLHELVRRINFSGRFNHPPFGRDEAVQYYQLRVEKAVRGLFDDVCLVLAPVGGIVGFLLLKFAGPDQCEWTLMGIDPKFPGVGGVQALMVAGEQLCLQIGRPRITMKAQMGNRVIRLYKFFGFTPSGRSWHLYRMNGPQAPTRSCG